MQIVADRQKNRNKALQKVTERSESVRERGEVENCAINREAPRFTLVTLNRGDRERAWPV